MRLLAISDIHISYASNRTALTKMAYYPDDWLILAGDVGDSAEELAFGLAELTKRFAKVIWVPGNHDLWSAKNNPNDARGVAKYNQLVDICRKYDVVTPEDPYPLWPASPATRYRIAPLFLLYDYSFRPDHVADETAALAWAAESGVVATDEYLLHPDPYPGRAAWCAARCAATEYKLQQLCDEDPTCRTILINHYPMRQEHAILPLVPRFTIWCGTTHTHNWHNRFRADVVIYGHLHIRQTRHLDGVRFEEVSLGYPRHWREELGIDHYLRVIL